MAIHQNFCEYEEWDSINKCLRRCTYINPLRKSKQFLLPNFRYVKTKKRRGWIYLCDEHLKFVADCYNRLEINMAKHDIKHLEEIQLDLF